jgi:hypothetical protein
MITSPRPHHSFSITLFFILSVILIGEARSAVSAGHSCDVFSPTNFEKLSLDKKIKVSEVIRACERKLKESHTKDLGLPQKETRAFANISARANRRAY